MGLFGLLILENFPVYLERVPAEKGDVDVLGDGLYCGEVPKNGEGFEGGDELGELPENPPI